MFELVFGFNKILDKFFVRVCGKTIYFDNEEDFFNFQKICELGVSEFIKLNKEYELKKEGR